MESNLAHSEIIFIGDRDPTADEQREVLRLFTKREIIDHIPGIIFVALDEAAVRSRLIGYLAWRAVASTKLEPR